MRCTWKNSGCNIRVETLHKTKYFEIVRILWKVLKVSPCFTGSLQLKPQYISSVRTPPYSKIIIILIYLLLSVLSLLSSSLMLHGPLNLFRKTTGKKCSRAKEYMLLFFNADCDKKRMDAKLTELLHVCCKFFFFVKTTWKHWAKRASYIYPSFVINLETGGKIRQRKLTL